MPIYISQKGLDDLRKEFEERKFIIRRDIAEKISSAKELGDLSENFEYQDAKEQQALNETRIAQLDAMIGDAEIVEQTTGNQQIGLGTTFIVQTGDIKKDFMMVGSTEADPLRGQISNESPIGQAFLGHRVGDVVEVQAPSGSIEYKIVEIH